MKGKNMLSSLLFSLNIFSAFVLKMLDHEIKETDSAKTPNM